MDVCRVCLATGPEKDVHQLKTSKKDGNKSPSQIMEFCLGIQIEKDSKITEKLCTKCFSKIRSFYKFKATALKNDSNLRSISHNFEIKLEKFNEVAEITENIESGSENNYYETEALTYVIKEESATDLESDDEILSTLKSEQMNLQVTETTEIKSEEQNFTEKEISVPNLVPKKRRKKTELSAKKSSQSGTKSKIDIIKPKVDRLPGQGVCDTCGKFVKDLKEHLQTHMPKHLRLTIKCKDKDCDKVFTNVCGRNKHYKIKHLGHKWTCKVCNKAVSSLSAHMKMVHEPDKMRYVCVSCDRRFVTPTALDTHMRSHDKQRPFTCEQCGNTYKQEQVLRNHIKSVHLKERSHVCQYCSKTFFKKVQLQYHLRTHTKEKPYECEQCGAKFSCKTTLKCHVDTHRTSKDYHCNLCSMSFVRQCYLRVHMNTHTKAKKYPCRYCGVPFGRSDHRKRHEFTAHEKHARENGGKTNMAAKQNSGKHVDVNSDESNTTAYLEDPDYSSRDVTSVQSNNDTAYLEA